MFSREVNFQVFTRSDISSEQDSGLPSSVPGEPPASLEPIRDLVQLLCWLGWCSPKLICEKCSCCRGTVIAASSGGLLWVGPVLDSALLSTSLGAFWWLVSAKLPSWTFQVPWAQREQIINHKHNLEQLLPDLRLYQGCSSDLPLQAGQGCGSPGVCLQLQLLHLQKQVEMFGA